MKNLGMAAALAIALAVGGCKQADGPLPDTTAPGRIGDLSDIGKDLMAIQAKDASGAPDFVEDLSKLCPEKPAEAAARELSVRVATAVQQATKLTMPDAVSLGGALYQTVAGRDISQSQAKTLRGEVDRLLTQAGVSDSGPVLEQMEAVHTLVAQRVPKWYEFF